MPPSVLSSAGLWTEPLKGDHLSCLQFLLCQPRVVRGRWSFSRKKKMSQSNIAVGFNGLVLKNNANQLFPELCQMAPSWPRIFPNLTGRCNWKNIYVWIERWLLQGAGAVGVQSGHAGNRLCRMHRQWNPIVRGRMALRALEGSQAHLALVSQW